MRKKRNFYKNEEIFFISSNYAQQNDYNTLPINSDDLSVLFKEGQLLYYRDGDRAFRVVKCISKDKVSVIPLQNIRIKANASIKCGAFIKDNTMNDIIIDFINRSQPKDISLSFVENPMDICAFKNKITYNTGKITSKIETNKGLLYLDDIMDHSDGIMLARGDLAFNSL